VAIDIEEVYRGPCRCGSGQCVIEVESPDHPYRGKTYLRFWIQCESCRTRYALVKRGEDVILVQQSSLKQREDRRAAFEEHDRRLRSSAEYRVLIATAARRLLEAGWSIAAIYGALPTFLNLGARTTFRRQVLAVGGIREWLDAQLNFTNLHRAVEWLDLPSSALDAYVVEAERLWGLAREPLTAVGSPVCRINRYWEAPAGLEDR